MTNSLESIGCYGQHGWKEFHRNRKDILAEFDKILEQTSNRPIQVAHGQGVEAYLRKWLANFLPKSYGVTSGYIIPDLYEDKKTLYHFDTIIYNQLESPVLWTEGNEDQNEQGKYRAIPARHVIAVFEVKSRFTKKNISDAFEKLRQTNDFEKQFHPLYRCYTIFVELKESDTNRESITKELINGKDIYGFNGGMILRYEGDDSCTGLIKIFDQEKEAEENTSDHFVPIAKPIDDINIYMTEDGNLQIAEQGGGARLVATSTNNWSVSKQSGVFIHDKKTSMHLSWSRSNFSEFCIDLLSSLEGLPYNDKRRPSFGMIFDRIKRKDAITQSPTPVAGKPFIDFQIYEGGTHGEKLTICSDATESKICFQVVVENKGDTSVVASDDSFKNQLAMDPGVTAMKPVTLIAKLKKVDGKLAETVEENPMELPYRIVYYEKDTEKHFIAVEKKIRISKNDIVFCE